MICFKIRCYRHGSFGHTSGDVSCTIFESLRGKLLENGSEASGMQRTKPTDTGNLICELVLNNVVFLFKDFLNYNLSIC